MKIVSSGGTISTDTYLERKRRARNKRLLFIFSSLFILLVLLGVISRLERFRIRDISVTGANVVGADTVDAFAREILSGYYLWLLPHDNALVYPNGELEQSLMMKFPRFGSVALTLSGLNKLNIEVIEREPYALYCGDSITAEGASCYFLDNTGFIFDLAPAFSEGVYFVYASDESLDNSRGRQLLPTTTFKSLTEFIQNLSSLNIHPLALRITPDDFDLLLLPHSAHLRLRRESDLNLIYSNLESFLKSEAIKSQADFLENIAELDLRTDNKVFYRFK